MLPFIHTKNIVFEYITSVGFVWMYDYSVWIAWVVEWENDKNLLTSLVKGMNQTDSPDLNVADSSFNKINNQKISTILIK